jgi:hypothetical protein
MGLADMAFLFALGVVYAVAYRLTSNILVLWPLLTPLGGWFNMLQSGDIHMPWAAILGFADVLGLMALVIWRAHKRQRRRSASPPPSNPIPPSYPASPNRNPLQAER